MQRASSKGGIFERTRVLTGAAEQGLQRLAPDFNANERLGELTEMIDKIDGKLAAIDADQDLSDSGKDRRKVEAKVGALGELQAWYNGVETGLLGHAGSLRATVAAETRPKDDPIGDLRREIRYAEIRRAFEGVDATELELAWPNLDQEQRDALKSAPAQIIRDKRTKTITSGPRVPDAIIAKHEAEPADPRLRQAGQIDKMREHLGRLVSSARRELGVRDDQTAYRVSEKQAK